MLYIKALHIIFIVTWFSGMFYIVRLFVYNTETHEKTEPERSILLNQLRLMTKRLWLGITVPSAVLTLIFGTWLWYLYGVTPQWLALKLGFVGGLYLYFLTLNTIYGQQMQGIFKYTSSQLRIWNEVATIFLVAIVMLVVVKENMSVVWSLVGLFLFIIVLMSAIKIYKNLRTK
ncbi:MAG: CopD family protein [Saprospiraceae bacterium]|nr:CopD family protein [Saprospiraceae bacterium]